jgi:phosphoribosyl-ATP pyrophosphohydrolase/phosphoribosyl-AMP cyclohydrolase
MSDVGAPPPEPHFDAQGLVPAIAQDATTSAVLTLAYMNREAWEATLRTRRATFWSRSRQELWEKGATSGNTLHVRAVRLDCDRDAVLLLVDPAGPACHTGSTSCFFDDVSIGGAGTSGGDSGA